MIFNAHLLFALVFIISISLETSFFVLCKIESSGFESRLLACGDSSAGNDSDGRKWQPDADYIVSKSNSSTAKAQDQDPSLPSVIPYMSARIFTTLAIYQFSVPSRTRIWIRLHFYPSTYDSFNPDHSYFTVAANNFVLLRNFSAYLTARALTQAYIIREFSLKASGSSTLDLSFEPSSTNDGSYAFINGIEVIPTPDIFHAATMVGFSDHSVDVTNFTVQTMYRLNVGGQYIPASQDTQYGRQWYDDKLYLFGAADGVTSRAKIAIRFPTLQVTDATAPLDVYKTSRTMGPDAKLNRNYNLTWLFRVDANFTYVARFHFCDYQESKVNQRVFDIFVNNQTAQKGADVIGWSGSQGVPVYKDYAVYVSDKDGDDELFIALHPSVSMNPEFYDAILNGLEIFKLSDAYNNLAGPNPVPSPMMLEQDSRRRFKYSGSSKGTIIGGVLGVIAGLGVIGTISCLLLGRSAQGSHSGGLGWLPLYVKLLTSGSRSTVSGKGSAASNLSQGQCRHFSLLEIRNATNNFSESRVIGVGGFGKVFRGIIDQGTEVAVKRSNPSSQQGVHEFQTEIEMLSKLRHKHLVSLIGFCEEDGEMILVYDYMANGTLREQLYNRGGNSGLSWKQRLEICIGAARGLHYLHTGAKYTIIHRDVKTTNILLDDKWVAKVSDFGLSKAGPSLDQTHVSTVVKGSFGYLDPEYYRRQQLTEKSDVYSFGVVLFEVLCARAVIDPRLPKEQVSLADWAVYCQNNGILEDIIDPHLKGKINPDSLNKFADTAGKCLADNGLNRPAMSDVLWNLEYALQLQENTAVIKLVDENKAMEMPVIDKNGTEWIEDANDRSSNAGFSHLLHPQGR